MLLICPEDQPLTENCGKDMLEFRVVDVIAMKDKILNLQIRNELDEHNLPNI
jgi:hypothetical protein